MNKKQSTLFYLKNTYVRLKPSKIAGVGIFAIRDIPKNTNPFLGSDSHSFFKFKMADLKGLDRQILKMIDDFLVIEKDQTVMIPSGGLNNINISFYLNHSDKPNLKVINDGFNFITLRKIKKGEELTSSYAEYDYKYR